jgi:hypothetical protein
LTDHTVVDKFESSIATMTPSVRQRRLTLVIAAVVLIATVIIAPFGAIQLQRIDGFIPATESAIIISDFFYCRPAVQSVKDRWITRPSAARKRLFVQRTDGPYAPFDFSRCICAIWSSWCQTLDLGMAFYLLAFGITHFSDWLCLPD